MGLEFLVLLACARRGSKPRHPDTQEDVQHADTFYIRITIIDAIKNTKQRHRFVPYNLDQLLEIMSGGARSGNTNKISSGFGIPNLLALPLEGVPNRHQMRRKPQTTTILE